MTALRLWIRKSPVEGEPGKTRVEPWIVSAGLDGTLRRWKLSGESDRVSLLQAFRCNLLFDAIELLHPPPPPKEEIAQPTITSADVNIDEDEERELAELMGEE